ncbi:MAG: hypothetical protein OXF02_03595 [Simkaniaceae bacterium]|nr:hypothetical protein [Simkaniaceae bacterium]
MPTPPTPSETLARARFFINNSPPVPNEGKTATESDRTIRKVVCAVGTVLFNVTIYSSLLGGGFFLGRVLFPLIPFPYRRTGFLTGAVIGAIMGTLRSQIDLAMNVAELEVGVEEFHRQHLAMAALVIEQDKQLRSGDLSGRPFGQGEVTEAVSESSV